MPAWNAPSTEVVLFRPPARTFTYEAALEFCRPAIERLRHAPDGARNSLLNEAAKTLSHFGPEFWAPELAEAWLLDALPAKENGVRHWSPQRTIASAYSSAGGDWRAERVEATFRGSAVLSYPAAGIGGIGHNGHELAVPAAELVTRWVDPRPWLTGTYQPPTPTRGMFRSGDGKALLYAAAWHTVIGPTGAGKSWLAAAHVIDELREHGDRQMGMVAYVHFEESTMGSTIARLQALGIPDEVIVERFAWLECGTRWQPGEMAEQLARLPAAPTLLVLDGINAACTTHGQDPSTVAAVGWYRSMFVQPAARLGAAVLSLGHPPKARERQEERHSFGSTAWLDEVDGCGFRVIASKTSPIRKGATGYASLYSVKDRHGGIEQLGQSDRREGWTFLGTLVVDGATSGIEGRVDVRINAPRPEDGTSERDPIDVLAEAVVTVLSRRADRSYAKQAELGVALRESGITFKAIDLAAALYRLEQRGRLARDPEPATGRAWGGQLVDSAESSFTSEESE